MAFVFLIVVFFSDHYYAGMGVGVSNKHCLLSSFSFDIKKRKVDKVCNQEFNFWLVVSLCIV